MQYFVRLPPFPWLLEKMVFHLSCANLNAHHEICLSTYNVLNLFFVVVEKLYVYFHSMLHILDKKKITFPYHRNAVIGSNGPHLQAVSLEPWPADDPGNFYTPLKHGTDIRSRVVPNIRLAGYSVFFISGIRPDIRQEKLFKIKNINIQPDIRPKQHPVQP